MRHAEKPEDHNNPYLAEAGRARAEQLVPFVTAKYGRPDFVFAAAVNAKSVRSYLTIRPLCDAFAIPLDTSWAGENYRGLANKLLSEPPYAGKLVVACWTHDELPQFANALRAPRGDYPDPWDRSVFDLILQLDYNGHAAPTVTKVIEPF